MPLPSPPSRPSPPRPARGPLGALLASGVLSVAAYAVSLVAVPWFVLQSSGSAARTGVVAFCAAAPIAPALLLGAPVLDLIGRRRAARAADLVCAAALALIPLLHGAGRLPFWLLCALVALTGLCHAPAETARSVLVPDAAGRAGVATARAVGVYQGLVGGSRPGGMALAGLLVPLAGVPAALLAAGGLFTAAALAGRGLWDLPAATRRPGAFSVRGYGRDLREGCAFVVRGRLLLGICLTVMASNGVTQSWNAVFAPVHAERHLGGAAALGLLSALVGAGSLAGALAYGAWGHRLPRRTLFAVCFVLAGAPRFATAAATGGVVPLAVVMAVGALATGALNPVLFTVFHEVVPDRLRSRAVGTITAAALLAGPLGSLLAGWAVDAAGLRPALLAFAGGALTVSLAPLVFPVWRGLDAPARRRAAGPDVTSPPAGPGSLPSRPGPSGGA